MNDTKGKLRHGGDVDAAEKAFGAPVNGWLDLSTGINPVPYPVEDIGPQAWNRLPTESDQMQLIDAARAYYGVPDVADVIAAPGTQAVIQWLPVKPGRCRVQIIGPTYEEHAASWRARGHDVAVIDDIAMADADVVVVVNPNNPDGRRVTPDVLLETADRLAGRGILIVDEAFADVTPGSSVTPCAGRPGLLILRSFGKFFGLAGLRLGFAVGTAFDIDILRKSLGPWAVAGPALQIGTKALRDRDWQRASLTRLCADAERLDEFLVSKGMNIVGGTPLYRLAQTDRAPEMFELFGRAGIMVRKFDYDPSWLRFGLPGDEDDWKRFEMALA